MGMMNQFLLKKFIDITWSDLENWRCTSKKCTEIIFNLCKLRKIRYAAADVDRKFFLNLICCDIAHVCVESIPVKEIYSLSCALPTRKQATGKCRKN